MDKLKRKDLPKYRESLRLKQGGICPLCRQPLSKEDAVLDHDHVSGHCRAALHSHCNSMEGKFANWHRSFGKDVDPVTFLHSLSMYWEVDFSSLLIHPTHRTETDKEVRKLTRRLKQAKRETTKERLKQEIKQIKESNL